MRIGFEVKFCKLADLDLSEGDLSPYECTTSTPDEL